MDENSLTEFSRDGRDERFSDGRVVVLLVVGAGALFAVLAVLLILWVASIAAQTPG